MIYLLLDSNNSITLKRQKHFVLSSFHGDLMFRRRLSAILAKVRVTCVMLHHFRTFSKMVGLSAFDKRTKDLGQNLKKYRSTVAGVGAENFGYTLNFFYVFFSFQLTSISPNSPNQNLAILNSVSILNNSHSCSGYSEIVLGGRGFISY